MKLENLGMDVLEHIFQRLTPPDLLNVMLTNSRLYSAVMLSYIDIEYTVIIITGRTESDSFAEVKKSVQMITDQTNWTIRHLIVKITNYDQPISHLRLRERKDALIPAYDPKVASENVEALNWKYLDNIADRVKCLDISIALNKTYENTIFDISSVFRQFSSLEKLEIQSVLPLICRFREQPFKVNRSLVWLKSSRIKIHDCVLKEIRKFAPNIRYLDLHQFGYFGYLSTMREISAFRNLHELRVRSISSLQLETPGQEPYNPLIFPYVVNLSLIRADQTDINFGQLLAFHFPKLENLTINSLESAEIIEQIGESKELNLKAFKVTIDDAFDVLKLKLLSSLESLNICFQNLDWISQPHLNNFLDSLQTVTGDSSLNPICLNINFSGFRADQFEWPVLSNTILSTFSKIGKLKIFSLVNNDDPLQFETKVESLQLHAGKLTFLRVGNYSQIIDQDHFSRIQNQLRNLEEHFGWTILSD